MMDNEDMELKVILNQIFNERVQYNISPKIFRVDQFVIMPHRDDSYSRVVSMLLSQSIEIYKKKYQKNLKVQ